MTRLVLVLLLAASCTPCDCIRLALERDAALERADRLARELTLARRRLELVLEQRNADRSPAPTDPRE